MNSLLSLKQAKALLLQQERLSELFYAWDARSLIPEAMGEYAVEALCERIVFGRNLSAYNGLLELLQNKSYQIQQLITILQAASIENPPKSPASPEYSMTVSPSSDTSLLVDRQQESDAIDTTQKMDSNVLPRRSAERQEVQHLVATVQAASIEHPPMSPVIPERPVAVCPSSDPSRLVDFRQKSDVIDTMQNMIQESEQHGIVHQLENVSETIENLNEWEAVPNGNQSTSDFLDNPVSSLVSRPKKRPRLARQDIFQLKTELSESTENMNPYISPRRSAERQESFNGNPRTCDSVHVQDCPTIAAVSSVGTKQLQITEYMNSPLSHAIPHEIQTASIEITQSSESLACGLQDAPMSSGNSHEVQAACNVSENPQTSSKCLDSSETVTHANQPQIIKNSGPSVSRRIFDTNIVSQSEAVPLRSIENLPSEIPSLNGVPPVICNRGVTHRIELFQLAQIKPAVYSSCWDDLWNLRRGRVDLPLLVFPQHVFANGNPPAMVRVWLEVSPDSTSIRLMAAYENHVVPHDTVDLPCRLGLLCPRPGNRTPLRFDKRYCLRVSHNATCYLQIDMVRWRPKISVKEYPVLVIDMMK